MLVCEDPGTIPDSRHIAGVSSLHPRARLPAFWAPRVTGSPEVSPADALIELGASNYRQTRTVRIRDRYRR